VLTVHVVSHTHWDREWYHPADRFRQRLVDLIDELLDDSSPERATFLLDGQAVVIDDYLAVRPERAAELGAALRDGRLEAGPWYVLADELIPGGEGLVRNLLTGRRTLRALRAEAPPVLYCPDSFGHPAALPVLARGFDKGLVILWRGFGGGDAPRTDTSSWVAANGDRVLLYHLTRSGYELGANLPVDPVAARERWKQIRAEIGGRARTGAALLMNGADHHARQNDLHAAMRTLEKVTTPDHAELSSLGAFAADLATRVAGRRLSEIRGELRDSYGYTWTLQGTLASRTPQKRRYAQAERELVRDVEPWTALVAFAGGQPRRHLVRAAWRPLLLCQPHDTLCGCSVDAVARAADERLDSVGTQAEGLREDAIYHLVRHNRDDARRRQNEWHNIVLVRNRAPRHRSGVAIVEFDVKLADVPVGPGSAHVTLSEKRKLVPPIWPVQPVQLLDVVEGHQRVESPRGYPDNDAVARLWSAVWVHRAPPYGVASVPTDSGEATSWIDEEVEVRGRSMTNGQLTLRWDARGRVALSSAAPKRVIRGLVGWESRTDVGDLYTPSVRQKRFKPRLLRTNIVHRGPLTAAVEQHWTFADRTERTELRVRYVLDAGAQFLRVGLIGDNSALDHRLRIRFVTDVNRGQTLADAAFGTVERTQPVVQAKDARIERPVPTAPLHRYVSLFNTLRGATVFSDGLTEYETHHNEIIVTLIRSVGELSRSDLPERPGHAGWPASTPEAQCIGPFEAEFGFLMHGPRTPAVIDEIERTADDVLLPLAGETLRSAIRIPPTIHGVELNGAGLALSAVKEAEEGDWMVLRCVNLLDQEVAGSWRLARPLREARLARLDETPVSPISVLGESVPFKAPKRGVVTILVR
jgi:alpha-mannosidase